MNKSLSPLTPVRILMVIGLLVFIILLQMGTPDSKSSLEEVSQAVSASVSLEGMEESSNQMFKKFYGLNANDYEGVSLYAPASNMDAEEILIIKLKDSSQAEAVTAAVNKRLETQKSSFEGYGIEQFDLLEDHILDVQGNFILYVVHPEASKADQAFKDSL
jgi:multidrug efflux pump subunit AcrB